MVFLKQKKDALNNLSASERVGDVDENLKSILACINHLPDYYTTSSCSGRITLMVDKGGKGENTFLAKWHNLVSVEDVMEKITSCDGSVWFKYESPIFHVVARDIIPASKLLVVAHQVGFKRSGIQSVKDERVVLEIISTERMELPVVIKGKVLVSDEFMCEIVAQANKRYGNSMRKIRVFEAQIREKL